VCVCVCVCYRVSDMLYVFLSLAQNGDTRKKVNNENLCPYGTRSHTAFTPSAALIKAIMINSAVPLMGQKFADLSVYGPAGRQAAPLGTCACVGYVVRQWCGDVYAFPFLLPYTHTCALRRRDHFNAESSKWTPVRDRPRATQTV
jgi:hypothetical protein